MYADVSFSDDEEERDEEERDEEREKEREEMISIYDSYVKNGVEDTVPDDDGTLYIHFCPVFIVTCSDGAEEVDASIAMTGSLSERIQKLRLYQCDFILY